jgi:hypothetical protein
MLVGHRGFAGMVSIPNRILWLGNKVGPRKDQATNSDRPEIRIDPGTPFLEPSNDSGNSKLISRWNVLAATDRQQLDNLGLNGLGASILPVIWEIYRALIGWQQAMLNLVYNATRFIYKVRPGSLIVNIDDKDLARGLCGWCAGWVYEVHMQFSTPAILPVPV